MLGFLPLFNPFLSTRLTKALGSFMRFIEYYYPLSFLGSFSFFVCIYLAGRAVGTGNLYALLISVPGLFFIIGQVVFIRLWCFRLRDTELVFGANQKLAARTLKNNLVGKLSSSPPPYFFRYHFLLHGTLRAGKRARFYYARELSSSTGGEFNMDMYFPLCGVFSVKVRILCRDILGFSRTRIDAVLHREFCVHPPALEKRPLFPRSQSTSLETRQRKSQAEEEKYYMREYIPGDRLKDINWKSSLRVGEMITRIASQSPEKNPLLSIELRNLTYLESDTLRPLLHFNFLKSWLFSFLLEVKRESPQYSFFVSSAETEHSLETDMDIDNFASVLAKLEYVQGTRWRSKSEGPPVLEKFIFTTAFDPSLKGLKGLNETMDGSANKTKYHIFQVLAGKGKESSLVRLLPLEYSVPWPGKWVLRPSLRPFLPPLPVLGTGEGRRQQMLIQSRLF